MLIFQKITFYISLLFSLFQGIWRCYLEYSRLQEQPSSRLNAYTIGIQTDISMYFRLKQTWFALSEWILKFCFVKIVITRKHFLSKENLCWYNLLNTSIGNIIKISIYNTTSHSKWKVIEGNLLYNLRKCYCTMISIYLPST